MYEGKITGFRAPDVPVTELGLLMAGVDPDARNRSADGLAADDLAADAGASGGGAADGAR